MSALDNLIQMIENTIISNENYKNLIEMTIADIKENKK